MKVTLTWEQKSARLLRKTLDALMAVELAVRFLPRVAITPMVT